MNAQLHSVTLDSPLVQEARGTPQLRTDDRTPARLATCRCLLRERRMIGDSIGFHLCAVPVWDILLDLYLAEQEGRPMYLWQSCVAANIPISSAHRKIGEMVSEGLLERTTVLGDKRCIGIRLTESCIQRLDALMDQLAAAP